jgi:PKD repeat protein
MKINNKKRSVALLLIAIISLLALVSSASAAFFKPLPPRITDPYVNANFEWTSESPGAPPYLKAHYPIFFTDKSTSKFTITSWNWDFGDNREGTFAPGYDWTRANPIYYYNQGGKYYTVTETVTNSFGFSSTATHTIYVYE